MLGRTHAERLSRPIRPIQTPAVSTARCTTPQASAFKSLCPPDPGGAGSFRRCSPGGGVKNNTSPCWSGCSSYATGTCFHLVCLVLQQSLGVEVRARRGGGGGGVVVSWRQQRVGKFTETSRVVKGKIDKTDTRRAECGLGTAIQAHCSDHVPATLMALTASRAAERTRTVTAADGLPRCRRRASLAI